MFSPFKSNYPPILIFQMGKVGSSSLYATLRKRWKGSVVQAHKESQIPGRVLRAFKERQAQNKQNYIICPVREPVARNISAFFENWKRDTGVPFESREWDVPTVKALFLERARHSVFDNFIKERLEPLTGINVYNDSFNKEQRWQTYKTDGLEMLIYRTDLPRIQQLSVISSFLKIEPEIQNFIEKNIGSQKPYAEAYADFKNQARFPESYLNSLYNSKTMKQFWSGKEIETLRSQWKE